MNPGDSATRQEVLLGGPSTRTWWEDITWPDQVAPRGRKASDTRKIKPQTSNLCCPTAGRLTPLLSRPIAAGLSNQIFSCTSPCLSGVASLYLTVPRNQTHRLGCPLSVAPNTLRSSTPSGFSGCMALRSSGVSNGHVSGFGLNSGGASATLGAGLGLRAL